MSVVAKPKTLTFRDDEDVAESLSCVADALNKSTSEVVRIAVRQFLAKPGVMKLSTMSLEGRIMFEVANRQAGLPPMQGIEWE
jgi:antitoxin component of RelBE/YafQ-DinJ toxin-antitoxin module